MAASLLSTSTVLAGLPSPLAMRRNCEFHTSALEPSSLIPRRCCPYVEVSILLRPLPSVLMTHRSVLAASMVDLAV